MKTIWKYQLPHAPNEYGICEVVMPKGAKIISTLNQYNTICLWAEVESDPSHPVETKKIDVVGTGKKLEDSPRRFLGSVILGQFVWHIYEML
jgi:hypothetical protein